MTTTYTIYRQNNDCTPASGNSLEAAARELLIADDNSFECRRIDDGSMVLFHGQGEMTECGKFFSISENDTEAEREIFQQVVDWEHGWSDHYAMPDSEFEAITE